MTGLGTTPPAAPTVTMVHNGPTRMRVHVSGADEPFWLVLGQSQSPGWKARVVQGGDLGPSQLVDGYANGWLVRPDRASFDVVLEWTPQRQVWAAIWISLLAALGVHRDRGLGVRARPPASRRADAVDPADADVWLEWPLAPRGAAGLPARPHRCCRCSPGWPRALVVAPWVGVLVALLVAAIQWRPRLRVVLVLAPAVLMLLVTRVHRRTCSTTSGSRRCSSGRRSSRCARPLAWVAVVLLGVDVVLEHVAGAALATSRLERARRSVNEPSGRRPIRDNHPCSRCAISRSKWVAGTR